MNIPAPKFVATSNLIGTAPWSVGCIAIPAGPYQVTWTIAGSAQTDSGNAPQTTPVASFWIKDPGNNTIWLTITNPLNNSDTPYVCSFSVVVNPNPDVGHITGFSMRPASMAGFSTNYPAIDTSSPMGFFLATDIMLPCIKWDYDLNSEDPQDHECSRDTSPNHPYSVPKVISGKVTLYYPSEGPCTCNSTPAGSKDFSLLVYDPGLLKH